MFMYVFNASFTSYMYFFCYKRNLLLYTLLPEADFDALMLKKSMDGLGTNEELIIRTLVPLNNERILAAKERHDEKVRYILHNVIVSTMCYS